MIQVLIALLLFTFFALGGLVSDLGFARLAHRQMLAGTGPAALEGMRRVDIDTDPDRRDWAAHMMRIQYDNDFNIAAGDPYRFGAGPDVTLTGGTGSMAANQQINVAAGIVYKPDPRVNISNQRHGDMVGGYYDETDLAHTEDPAYVRSDFSTTPVAGWRDAFLVRLRRTTGASPLDSQAGISSRGPQIPYLFARGSLLAAGSRVAGVTVRGTSVALARNATLAGPPLTLAIPGGAPLQIDGAAPFVIEYDYWNASIPTGSQFDLRFGGSAPGVQSPRGGPPLPNPNPTQGGPPIIPPGQMLPGVTDPPRAVFTERLAGEPTTWSMGDPVWVDLNVDSDVVLARLGNPEAAGYTPRTYVVPIYEGDIGWFYDGRPGNSNPPFLPPVTNVPKDTWDPRVVGFGTIIVISAVRNADTDPNDGVDDSNVILTIQKQPTFVWPQNVSAIQTPRMADLPSWLAREITQLNATVDEPARAAALVR